MVVTSNATYLFESKEGKLKQKISHTDLRGKLLFCYRLKVFHLVHFDTRIFNLKVRH